MILNSEICIFRTRNQLNGILNCSWWILCPVLATSITKLHSSAKSQDSDFWDDMGDKMKITEDPNFTRLLGFFFCGHLMLNKVDMISQNMVSSIFWALGGVAFFTYYEKKIIEQYIIFLSLFTVFIDLFIHESLRYLGTLLNKDHATVNRKKFLPKGLIF